MWERIIKLHKKLHHLSFMYIFVIFFLLSLAYSIHQIQVEVQLRSVLGIYHMKSKGLGIFLNMYIMIHFDVTGIDGKTYPFENKSTKSSESWNWSRGRKVSRWTIGLCWASLFIEQKTMHAFTCHVQH